MNSFVAICLLALAASARADGPLLGSEGLLYAPGHASADYYTYPKYAFDYAVKDPHTGDNKAQWEKRDGDSVKGAYSLVEPDGSLRVVEYWADDKHGFNAVVKRIGPNLHPTPVKVEPIYKADIPTLPREPIGIAPLSIGPVAGLGALSSAPLIHGPSYGAVSSASLIKNDIPIVKAPILKPILPVPLYKTGPILPPIYKTGPIVSEPIYREGPILPSIYKPLPIYNSIPLYKAPYNSYETSYRVPLGPIDYLSGGIGSKGPYESSLNKYYL